MELATNDRLTRERDYHNQRAVKETRDAQSKYYSAILRGGNFEKAIARLSAGADILEYGCGSAPMLFDDHCRDARSLTGIDIAEVAIAMAERQALALNRSAHFAAMDAEH